MVDRLRADSVKHAKRLQTERSYLDEWKVRTRMRVHPVLKNHDFVVARAGPVIVFVENAEDRPILDPPDIVAYLADFQSRLEEALCGPVGVPSLSKSSRESDRLRTVVVLRGDRGTRVSGAYLPAERQIHLVVEPGTVEPGQIRRDLVGDLVRRWFRAQQESGTPPDRVAGVTIWLQEGLVDLMATPDGEFALARPRPGLRRTWSKWRKEGLADWTLGDLFLRFTIPGLIRVCRTRGSRVADPVAFLELFRA